MQNNPIVILSEESEAMSCYWWQSTKHLKPGAVMFLLCLGQITSPDERIQDP